LQENIIGSNNKTPKNAKRFDGFDEESPHVVSKLKNGFENKIVQTDSGSGVKQAPIKFQTVVSNIQTPHQFMDNCKRASTASFQSPLVGRLKNGYENKIMQPDSGGVKKDTLKFQTAAGRSLSISSDVLKRARSLLGDPDLGDFFDGGDSLLSSPDMRTTSAITSFVERSESNNNTHTPLVHQMTPESNHNQMTKSFTYPLQPSRQIGFSNKLVHHEGNGNNLIMKFDDVANESDYGRQSSNTPGQQKPLYNRNEVVDSTIKSSSLNGFSSRMDSRGKPLGKALVDISNTTKIVPTYNKQPVIRKRRLGLNATVSPFKKPRISTISASGDQHVQNFHNGMLLLRVFSTFFLLLYVAGPIILISICVILQICLSYHPVLLDAKERFPPDIHLVIQGCISMIFLHFLH